MKNAVILVSGGADSATVLAMIEKMNYQIYAISFNYNQRNSVELKRVKELVKNYNNVKQHQIIDIDLYKFVGSALTDNTIDVPKYKDHKELQDDIPITYVPARNTIFLSYALGFSEVVEASDIFIGAHATDYAHYPDCRPEYIKAFEQLANLATSSGVSGKRITIHAPLITMTKGEVIKTGLDLGVDYSKTISCYDPSSDGMSCGTCHSCLIRLKAFQENNTVDPISYRN